MTAERGPMTLNESSVPALGVEERSDEAPKGRARKTDPGPGGRGQAEAAPVHRAVSAADPRGGGALYAARRGGSAASPRGVVQLPSDGLAQGAAQGFASGVSPEEARRKAGRTQPTGCEGARARDESGSPGARTAHRAHDLGRTGKNFRAAGIEPRTRNALLMAAQPLAVQVGVAPACQALGVSRATFYRRQRPTPGHQQPRPTPARALCESGRGAPYVYALGVVVLPT